MNPRERLENCIAGQPLDRVPVALWRHFPGDDQRTADFAQSLIQYQRAYEWDFVVIAPTTGYSVADYGVQSIWSSDLHGDRRITHHTVTRSLDWTELRPLDPNRGELGKQLECVRILRAELGAETPLIMTIHSPLAQARRLSGEQLLLRNLRAHPDRLRSGLSTLTENTLRFMEALRRAGVDGIQYVVEHAHYDSLSEPEYSGFGMPYDRKILGEVPPVWWLNTLHIRGEHPMFTLLQDYPVQAVSWQITAAKPDLPQGKSGVRGAVCGGLNPTQHLINGTPLTLRDEIRRLIQISNGRRFILSAEGAVPLSTPLSNLRAIRQAVLSASAGER